MYISHLYSKLNISLINFLSQSILSRGAKNSILFIKSTLFSTIIKEKEYASSRDIKFDEKVDWAWNPTSLSRATLESLYFRGELIIHHKKGTIKHYGIASDHIPEEILNAGVPHSTIEEYLKWRVLRRIGAVGLLWNKPSDALLGIGLKSANRNTIFKKLLNDGKIIEIKIEDITNAFYCLSDDRSLLNY